MTRSKLFHTFTYAILIAFCLSSTSYSLNIDTSSRFVYPEYSKNISMDFKNAQGR